MRTHIRNRPSILRALAGALLFLLCNPCLAEVGVIYAIEFSDQPRGPYELRGIIDDGEPVLSAWRVHSAPADHRFVLNPNGEINQDGQPSLAFNIVNDLPMVAWAKNSPGGYDVVLSCFANGAWTDPLVLAEDATVSEPADPVLVINPTDGSIHVLYWTDDAWPRVIYRHAPADLSSWSDPVQVSQPGERAVRPGGAFYNGLLHVVYETHAGQLGGTPRQIVLAVENGSGFTSEVVGTTNYSEPNRPQVHGAGAVLWVDWIDAAGEMTWTRREGPGPWDPIEIEPFASAEERDYHVRNEIEGQALN